MSRLSRPIRRAAVLALGAMLLLAGPAAAHPFVPGGEAPVDSRAEVTMRMAHGCLTDGEEDEGHSHGDEDQAGDPTIEVAMEVPETVRILDAPAVDGYEPAFERADDGRIEVVTWTATDGGEPAPDLPFEAVFEGEPGDELYLKVFQACDDFVYRWVGTPDEPADDPAIRVTLTAADPDNPAPEPEDAPEPEEGAGTDAEGGTAAEDGSGEAEAGAEEAATDVDGEDADQPTDATEDAADEATTTAATETGSSALPWIIAAIVAVVLVGAIVPPLLRRRSASDSGQA